MLTLGQVLGRRDPLASPRQGEDRQHDLRGGRGEGPLPAPGETCPDAPLLGLQWWPLPKLLDLIPGSTRGWGGVPSGGPRCAHRAQTASTPACPG